MNKIGQFTAEELTQGIVSAAARISKIGFTAEELIIPVKMKKHQRHDLDFLLRPSPRT